MNKTKFSKSLWFKKKSLTKNSSKLFIFAPLCSRICVANIVTGRGTHRPRTKYYRITAVREKKPQNIRELLGSTSQYKKWTVSWNRPVIRHISDGPLKLFVNRDSYMGVPSDIAQMPVWQVSICQISVVKLLILKRSHRNRIITLSYTKNTLKSTKVCNPKPSTHVTVR